MTYPHLDSAVETWGTLDALAEASGLTPDIIEAVLHGGVAASLSVRARLARVLDADPVWLFQLPPELEALLPPDRFVTDPATLRAIDSRGAA